MGNIKAGCVVVTEFCRQGDERFTGYINYIDRDEAIRNETTAEYNLYQNYMGNPEKTTGLFTDDKDNLTSKEKKDLKLVFKEAQKNGSLMWQTVISFDNRWLANNGLYNLETGVLDERRLKAATRKSVNKMLHNEGMDNAVWSAAFHYNTGNIHVHIATVEPVPMREQKSYIQYDEVIKDGKKIKFAIRDENGEPVRKMEYKGRFKQSSIDFCKSEMVNEILNEKENNLKINNIIRESIVKQKQSFAKDEKLRKSFEALHSRMPKCNKNMWKYNNQIMAKLRPEIDRLSDLYIREYHSDDFETLKNRLKDQEIAYKEAYGNSGRSYSEGKIKDLHERLGNAILKEIREYDKKLKEIENKNLNIEEIIEGVMYDPLLEIEDESVSSPYYFPREEEEKEIKDTYDVLQTDEEKELEFTSDLLVEDESGVTYDPLDKSDDISNYIDSQLIETEGLEPELYLQPQLEPEDIFCEWNETYKEAKRFIYNKKPKYEKARESLEDEHYAGNVLATYELGDMYKYGRGCEINNGAAQQYYKASLENFIYLYNHGQKKQDNQSSKEKQYGRYKTNFNNDEREEWLKSYFAYRVGKQYYYAQGTEQDYQKTEQWMKLSGNNYAKYVLGKMAYYGQGEEKNYKKAFDYFYELSIGDKKDFNAYACYKAAYMLENKEIDRDIDYNKLYEKALNEFLSMKEDDNLDYRIGMMYLKGKGTKVDKKKAESYLTKSAEAGNVYAKYQLAEIYLERGKKEEIDKAVEYLNEAATKGDNTMAMYSLGKVYSSDMKEYRDIDKAIYWYGKAEEKGNEFASYKLGKIYVQQKKYDEAIKHFMKSNNKHTYYALGKIHLDQVTDEGKYYDINVAIKYFERTMEEGGDYAAYKLGNIYESNEHGVKNIDKAIYWYKKAEENDNQFASYRLGKIYILQGENKKAIKQFEKCIDNQHAKYILGKMAYNGEGQEKNYEKAFSYFYELSTMGSETFNAYACYRTAHMLEHKEVDKNIDYNELYQNALEGFLNMEQDDSVEYRIGMMYLKGKGTDIDKEKAEDYLTKSAQAGNLFAKYHLAEIYLERGEKEEVEKAVEYLNDAATEGDNVMAMYSLGKVYSSDMEEYRDIDKAIYWYGKAEEKGNEFASYKLGKIYVQKKKYDEAVKHFMKSDNKYSYYELGKICLDRVIDEGRYYDVNKAINYFEKSEPEGETYADYKLGNIYESDEHGVKDIDKAVYWYEKAEEKGNQFASYRLGKLYMSLGKNEKAIKHFDKCVDNEYASYFSGSLYMEQGDYKKAIAHFENSKENSFSLYKLG